MNLFKNKILVFILSLVAFLNVDATHIVGGVVTYKYLGANKYELTFKVYRDCESQTSFDGDPNNLNIGLFYYTVFENATGIVRHNDSLFYKSKGKVNSVIVNDCLDTAQSCVEEAIYMDTITIADPTKWYSVVYQRCCRNSGINNLQPNAGGGGGGSSFPGMTIYTNIPPTNTYSNNSAVFKKFPPLFLCLNQPFNFDHSATDVDGDVLKYYLVTPLDGGSNNNPKPTVASFTKSLASWQTPYSLTNVIGGSPTMSIDVNTGLLTCTPDVVGRYVVSIMVKEFRSGICIDSTIRDFQFNVNDCDIPSSYLPYLPGTYDPNTRIGDYKVNCTDNKIDFVNASTNASKFLWNFGDPSSGTLDTSSLTNPSHIYNDTGVYIVTLISYKTRTDNKLCSDTLRRRVRIFPTYRSNFSFPISPPICIGSNLNFTDLSTGTYGTVDKWTWDFGDGGISTIKNPTHIFTSSGTFNVKLTSETTKKCVDDTTISVKVFESPTINAFIPNACVGQLFTVKCNNSVAAPSVITNQKWTLPNRTDTACNTTYTPPNMNPFNIKLWAKTDKGCVDSQIFTIPVNSLPTITTTNDTTICYDQKAQLNTTGGIAYLWNTSSELNDINIGNPIASPTYPNPSLYIVKGTDAKGCYNYDSVKVSFRIKPFISAGLDTNVCLNPSPFKLRDSVILNGQGNFTTVYWTPTTGLNNPNIKNPSSKPKSNTDYVFNGIDLFGCIVKDTLTVIVLDPNLDLIASKDVNKCVYDTIIINPIDQGIITKYTWSPNIWISNNLQRNPKFFSRDTVLYILYVENYCYNKYDSIRVDVIPNPQMRLPDLDSMCRGDIYQFNLNPKYTYNWSSPDPTLSSKSIFNPTASPGATIKYYYVTATDNYGCISKDSMELIVNYPPNVTVLGKPKFLCLGDSVKLSVITNLRTWVKWSNNTNISNDTAKETYFFPPTTEKFYIRAYTAVNCFTTDSFIIPVQKPIKPNVLSPVHVCKGKFIDLYASGGLYYLWTPPYNIQDTIVDKPQVFPDTTMTYRVKISNDCFIGYDSVNVIVDSLPTVSTTIDTSIYRGAEIELTAETKAYSIEWSPENMINTNVFEKKIKVSPQDTTLYKVRVEDGNGCVGYDSVWVQVYGKNVLLIPSGFSPNGDGINDIFRVSKHLNVKKLNYFEVYNRWGEKVFSTTNISQGWDGTYNGEPCPMGTYSWQIQVTSYENEKITKSGNIDIIR